MRSVSHILLLTGLFITISATSQVTSKSTQKPEFVSPLDIPIFLSGNYGEYRSGHFHAGIDFKTQQVEGKNVFAVDSGYIYRIVVQAAGYGNAVYLRHPSGFVTVYAHLSKFEPGVEKYVKEQQYRKKSFAVDLYPDAGRFVYRRGGFLGLSGNSGMSFGAHLHFEVRDKSGSVPLNPLEYGFGVRDRTRPEIRWLMIYPIDTGSHVNGSRQNLPLKVINSGRNNRVIPDTIRVKGNIGLGIESYDYLDNTPNLCSPNTIEVLVDNRQVFFCRLDSISFAISGQINSYFDYGEMLRTGRKIQKLYVDPNNTLTIYKTVPDRGILQLGDSGVHPVRIIVKDTYGNESELRFNLQTVSEPAIHPVITDSLVVNRFLYDSLNVFENENVRIVVPKNALFDNADFRYSGEKNDSIPYSLVHKVHDRYTPLKGSYILSLKPQNMPEPLQSRAVIAARGAKGKWISLGGEYNNGYVTANIKVFGDFIVTADSVAPEIKPVNFTAKGRYEAGQVISFKITDDLSGIQKYTGFIDNKWALFEYDMKNDLLTYTIDNQRLTRGILHELEIIVTDKKGNVERFKSSFYY